MKQLIKHYLPFLLAGIVFTILFTSCVLTDKQKKRFLANNCQSKETEKIVFKDTTLFRDSLIYIPQIINTPVYLENPCKLLCDSFGNLKPFYKKQSSKGLKTTVQNIGNSIVVQCETDSLKTVIKTLHRLILKERYSHTENTIEKPCELEHRTKFDGFTFYWFLITGCYVVFKLIKRAFGAYLVNMFPFLKIIFK